MFTLQELHERLRRYSLEEKLLEAEKRVKRLERETATLRARIINKMPRRFDFDPLAGSKELYISAMPIWCYHIKRQMRVSDVGWNQYILAERKVRQ